MTTTFKARCPFCKTENVDWFVTSRCDYATGEYQQSVLKVCTKCEIVLKANVLQHKLPHRVQTQLNITKGVNKNGNNNTETIEFQN